MKLKRKKRVERCPSCGSFGFFKHFSGEIYMCKNCYYIANYAPSEEEMMGRDIVKRGKDY